MVDTADQPGFEQMQPGVKSPAKETLLSPKFYTTDFDEMARMDISPNEEELRAILEELRADYNQKHFIRDEEFNQSWEDLDEETQRIIVGFLERSCTAEFSGFLLYKELGRRLKHSNPLLAECFTLMSRDEARHSGFLNKAMSDFNMSLDLGFLTKNKKYTFFKPKFVFYATYLSEKIGYWRYITIYRHLQENPEKRIYPLFRFFKNWCQDENRHGDFFDAMMKSQPHLVSGLRGRLWCRFFLLAVFGVMYVRDLQEPGIYEAIGLNTRNYDRYVIKKTNETAGRVFPVTLDVENPQFFERLEVCVNNNKKLSAIANSNTPKFLQLFRKLPLRISNGWQFLRLYLMKPNEAAAQQGVVH